jgi:hypothetical protein
MFTATLMLSTLLALVYAMCPTDALAHHRPD